MGDCSALPQEGERHYHVIRLQVAHERGIPDSAIALVQANIQHAQHLITIRGSRVTLVYEDLDLFAAICRKAKPLWDEHALIWTASPKTKYMLSKEENFGTWAD